MPDGTGPQDVEVKSTGLVDAKNRPLSSETLVPPKERSDFWGKTYENKMAELDARLKAEKQAKSDEFLKGEFLKKAPNIPNRTQPQIRAEDTVPMLEKIGRQREEREKKAAQSEQRPVVPPPATPESPAAIQPPTSAIQEKPVIGSEQDRIDKAWEEFLAKQETAVAEAVPSEPIATTVPTAPETGAPSGQAPDQPAPSPAPTPAVSSAENSVSGTPLSDILTQRLAGSLKEGMRQGKFPPAPAVAAQTPPAVAKPENSTAVSASVPTTKSAEESFRFLDKAYPISPKPADESKLRGKLEDARRELIHERNLTDRGRFSPMGDAQDIISSAKPSEMENSITRALWDQRTTDGIEPGMSKEEFDKLDLWGKGEKTRNRPMGTYVPKELIPGGDPFNPPQSIVKPDGTTGYIDSGGKPVIIAGDQPSKAPEAAPQSTVSALKPTVKPWGKPSPIEEFWAKANVSGQARPAEVGAQPPVIAVSEVSAGTGVPTSAAPSKAPESTPSQADIMTPLTVSEAEKRLVDAMSASINSRYMQALKQDPAFSVAEEADEIEWEKYQSAWTDSGQSKEDFLESPNGKMLHDSWLKAYREANALKQAFRLTPKGSQLYSEFQALERAEKKASDLLGKIKKTASTASTPQPTGSTPVVPAQNLEATVPGSKEPELKPVMPIAPHVWKPGGSELKMIIEPKPEADKILEVWGSVEKLVKAGHVLSSYSPADDGSSLDMNIGLGQNLSTQQIQEVFSSSGLTVVKADDNTVTLRFNPSATAAVG